MAGWRGVAAIIALAFVTVSGAGLLVHDKERKPAELTGSMTGVAGPLAPAVGAGDVDERTAALAARLKLNPNDIEGWRMLGWSYFNLQRYGESAEAYGRAVALDSTNTDLQSAWAEAVVQAAGGQVSSTALEGFESVLKRDPTEHRSRYYIALAMEQAGDLSRALDLWQDLLRDAPPDAG